MVAEQFLYQAFIFSLFIYSFLCYEVFIFKLNVCSLNVRNRVFLVNQKLAPGAHYSVVFNDTITCNGGQILTIGGNVFYLKPIKECMLHSCRNCTSGIMFERQYFCSSCWFTNLIYSWLTRQVVSEEVARCKHLCICQSNYAFVILFKEYWPANVN